jgi:hypothetical protein
MKYKQTITVILIMTGLSGCAELQQMAIENTCSQNQAYSAGVNDGRTNQQMQSNYAGICPTNQNQYNQSYASGYKFGLEQYSKKVDINIDNSNGGSGNNQSTWGCIKDPFAPNGQVCGYDCKKNNFGNIYCGKTKYDTCIKNNFGDIKCGKNCRISPYSSDITCEKEAYSKDSKKP